MNCPKCNEDIMSMSVHFCRMKDTTTRPPIVPLNTELPSGKVVGVQFMEGERYYFVTSKRSCGYLPAKLIEEEYRQQNEIKTITGAETHSA